jgi:hypothetical protein
MVWGFRLGRQHSGYRTFTFLHVKWPRWLGRWLLGFDGHVIHYPAGSHIPPHRDRVEHGRHFRINLVLWQPARGGEFVCEGDNGRHGWSLGRRLFVFRPDVMTHSVSRCEGPRVVLSFGWALAD